MGKLHELWLKQKGQIIQAAKPFLENGETPEFIILAQTRAPYWLLPLPFSAIYGVKKRAVAVTNRHVYLLDMVLLSPTKVSGVLERLPNGQARLKRGGMGAIELGTTKLWPLPTKVIRDEVDGALKLLGAGKADPG